MEKFNRTEPLSSLIGHSSKIVTVRKQIKQYASSLLPVAIYGQTGVGKELVARDLHQTSTRSKYPFVAINCAVLPENLIESELFGHVKGAFTGAISAHQGCFELVGKGTLFLDEIGDLPLHLQPKLLRVLESRVFKAVGGYAEQKFEGRLVVATHKNLKEMVKTEEFREDLYYRINVLEILMPSLDERKEDIVHLISAFSEREFTPDAIRLLQNKSWPGGVRELRSSIEKINLLSDQPIVDCSCIEAIIELQPEKILNDQILDTILNVSINNKLEYIQDLLIEYALVKCNGNKTAAASLLGVGRKTIEYRIKELQKCKENLECLIKLAIENVAYEKFNTAIEILHECMKLNSYKDSIANKFTVLYNLTICYRAIYGWLCPTAKVYADEALELAYKEGNKEKIAKILFGNWVSQLMMLELKEARRVANLMLELSYQINVAQVIDDASLALANVYYWQGNMDEVIHTIESRQIHLLFHAEQINFSELTTTKILSLNFLGLAYYHLGDLNNAAKILTFFEKLIVVEDRPFNRMFIYQALCWIAIVLNNYHCLEKYASSFKLESEQGGFSFYEGIAQIFSGCLLLHHGEYAQALKAIESGYKTKMMQNGGLLFHSFYAWKKSEVLFKLQKYSESLNVISDAIEIILSKNEKAYYLELLSLKAILLKSIGQSQESISIQKELIIVSKTLGLTIPCMLFPILIEKKDNLLFPH